MGGRDGRKGHAPRAVPRESKPYQNELSDQTPSTSAVVFVVFSVCSIETSTPSQSFRSTPAGPRLCNSRGTVGPGTHQLRSLMPGHCGRTRRSDSSPPGLCPGRRKALHRRGSVASAAQTDRRLSLVRRAGGVGRSRQVPDESKSRALCHGSARPGQRELNAVLSMR